MKKDELVSAVLGCSISGYYKWKKQDREIIELLEKYFTLNDLQEWITNKSISKLELLANIVEENVYAQVEYLNIFLNQEKASRFAKSSDYGYDFYFSLLVKIKNILGNEQVPFMNAYEYAWIVLYQTVSEASSFKDNGIIPIFSDFGCGANKALQMNLHDNYKSIIKVAEEDRLNNEEKKEAYIHALSYNLYSLYPEKSFAEKKHLLKSLLYSLFPNDIKDDPTIVFFNPFIEMNVNLIEKNYDLIIESLVKRQG